MSGRDASFSNINVTNEIYAEKIITKHIEVLTPQINEECVSIHVHNSKACNSHCSFFTNSDGDLFIKYNNQKFKLPGVTSHVPPPISTLL